MSVAAAPTFGPELRAWRIRRRRSQLDLASEAGVSTRHLSFVETGKARPSREMVLHLAEHLDVPLRERNRLLQLAGFSPSYRESDLGDVDLSAAHDAITMILRSHDPLPALAVDPGWDAIEVNTGMSLFLGLLPPRFLDPPNVIRSVLHPEALADAVVNFDEVANHLVARLRRQHAATGDTRVADLLAEVTSYPQVAAALASTSAAPTFGPMLGVHLRIAGLGDLRVFTTMTVLGGPLDVTLDEIAVESYFPADAATAAIFAGAR